MKKHILALFLCLLSMSTALCQQKGHFLLGGGTSVIFGSESPSILMYSLEAGISYNILESLRLTGTLGGFRSVMSFGDDGWQPQTANGPLARIGADYLFLPEGSAFRPSASLSVGYRLRVPPGADSPGLTGPPVRADGAFLTAGIGADICVGGLCLSIALTGELTSTLHPAAGIKLMVLLP